MDRLMLTKGVKDLVIENNIFAKGLLSALTRFSKKDWGNIGEAEKEANDDAVKNDGKIVAKYNTMPQSIYLIKEDDSLTINILFTED